MMLLPLTLLLKEIGIIVVAASRLLFKVPSDWKRAERIVRVNEVVVVVLHDC
jgi:hypothetical protein